jgi:hypothetical protein
MAAVHGGHRHHGDDRQAGRTWQPGLSPASVAGLADGQRQVAIPWHLAARISDAIAAESASRASGQRRGQVSTRGQ